MTRQSGFAATDLAEELWVQRQLRDIANRYEVVAKTIEIIHQD
jgi:hypothetical protein